MTRPAPKPLLTHVVAFLCRSASIRRLIWKKWYDFLASYRANDWTFMNYGYVPEPEKPPLPLVAEDEPNRCCIQLYHFVASSADLRGLNVLEVGSGRGGGASYVKRYLGADVVTGVDFSTKAVKFCNQRHRLEGLSFKVGNAEALPFDDASFDAVLNVESSHCYGSVDAFFGEVRRVLRPSGFFLHADLRDSNGLAAWKSQLNDSGMTLISETDITANVLAALDQDHERKAGLIRRFIPKPFIRSFADFAGLRGSLIYEGLRTGGYTYRAFTLQRKPS